MAGKKDIRERAKALWIRGMKAVGNTAANIASNTRYKVDEVTIQNRRREVLNDLAHKAYALWLKGESFPEPMDKMLEELKQLDEELNDVRAAKYALTGKPALAAETEQAQEEEEPEEEEPEEEEDDEPVSTGTENPLVTAEINDLFDETSSVGKSAEKVNQTLEQLSGRIRSFPQSGDTEESGQEEQE